MVLCTFIFTHVGAGLGIGISTFFGKGAYAEQVTLGMLFSIIFATVGFMFGIYADFILGKRGYTMIFN
jgi:membrane protein DedA with SNARE-associated domain